MSGKSVPEPNYTQAPNFFFDHIMLEITSTAELKVTLAIIRQTFGYHKKEDQLSLSQLMKLTKLSRESVADGIQRALKRGYVGRRKSGQSYIYGLRVASQESRPPDDSTSQDSRPPTSQESRHTKESKKESNDSSNDESAQAPMPMGQFGMKELAERVTRARERGAQIHSTTDRERKDFGAMFKRAAQDGHEIDHLLLALDYMVAKASGDVENEPKAWCGFRTALDRVMEGWRPKAKLRAVRDPEHERMVAENERLERELLAGLA